MKRGEQRHAWHCRVRWRRHVRHCGRWHAGKQMIRAGVAAELICRLTVIVLRIICGVVMRLLRDAMMAVVHGLYRSP